MNSCLANRITEFWSSGQNPALAYVTSDPTGAVVYVDYQVTTNVTPVVVDVGEAASHAIGAALHTITVRKQGYPYPAPRTVCVVEAETVSVHFDLTSTATGGVTVISAPNGAEVFVDYADSSMGVTPIMIGNLLAGSHTVILRKSGSLQPMPVTAHVSADTNTLVSVPLSALGVGTNLTVLVSSAPPGAQVYVDYLPTTNVTDVIVAWLDAALHAGSGWHSASHTIMLRGSGWPNSTPRYVDSTATNEQGITVGLIGMDSDSDGLPDWWEKQYFDNTTTANATTDSDGDGLNDRLEFQLNGDPTVADTDGDGQSDLREWVAGTSLANAGILFRVEDCLSENEGETNAARFVFYWETVTGRLYSVYSMTNLLGSWVTNVDRVPGAGNRRAFTNEDTEAPRKFFRIGVELAP